MLQISGQRDSAAHTGPEKQARHPAPIPPRQGVDSQHLSPPCYLDKKVLLVLAYYTEVDFQILGAFDSDHIPHTNGAARKSLFSVVSISFLPHGSLTPFVTGLLTQFKGFYKKMG